MSEAGNQGRIREHFSSLGWRLFRNNRGALPRPGGVPVRFGLGNDSAAVNRTLKSSDLIGWRPVTITVDMVGQTIAQVVTIEAKPEGWTFPPATDVANYAHCNAQRRWINMACRDGAIGGFMIDPLRGFEE